MKAITLAAFLAATVPAAPTAEPAKPQTNEPLKSWPQRAPASIR